ncbi:MAG: ATP-binding protein [Micromonospora sp.]
MRRQVPRGLPARLFLAQALVVLVGAGTLGLVAAALGPAIFRDHLRQVSGSVEPATVHHVEEAYTSAGVLSLGMALAASLIAALAVSAYVARRLGQPVEQLAAAAADVSHGDYTTRVAVAGLGPEFDTVAAAFNTMAVRLAEAETTRRRLLADLGHELRTPLATIEAYVDAAEDGIAVEGESTWNVLRTQTTRLRRLAEDVAAVSRAEEHQLDLRPRRIPAAELARTAVAAVRPRYTAKGVALRETVEADVGDVDADPERMGQVLGNLLDNALRHTPPGGQVIVTVGKRPADVGLSVSDTGEGIPSAHLPHVFERFYRSDTARDRDHGGSGIGLAVARAIVMQHGGRIEAASAGAGTGATFTITLPRADSHRPVE